MLYSDGGEITIRHDDFLFVHESDTLPTTYLMFDVMPTGEVAQLHNSCMNSGEVKYLSDSMEKVVSAMNYNEIIEILGDPKQEVKLNKDYTVMVYSKLKEGPFRGKKASIYIYRIVLNNKGIMEYRIRCSGSPFDEYIGMY